MKVNAGNLGLYGNMWNNKNSKQKNTSKNNMKINGKITVSGNNHVSVKLSNQSSSVNQKQDAFSLRKTLSGQGNNLKNQVGGNSIINSSLSYGESIRAAGTKAKDAALQVKKLQYSFKSVSSKLIRCKTSTGAKQVASQAKREIMRLRSQKQEGKYDKEELEAAITHAQAMERVAKKKARHLEEEEMAKAAGGVCAGDLEEIEKEEYIEENPDESDEAEMSEEMGNVQQNPAADIAEVTEDMLAELMAEMSEEMAELMKDMGLEELQEEMTLAAEKDMDPADLKLMKIKHRSSEMKDMAKADGEYLKAMFEKFERERVSAAIPGAQSGGSNAAPVGGAFVNPTMAIADVQTPTISIDISL